MLAGDSTAWEAYFLLVHFEKSYHAASRGGASLYDLSCDERGHLGTKVDVDILYPIAMTDYNVA